MAIGLENKDLWNEYYRIGTEMIVRPAGRYIKLYII